MVSLFEILGETAKIFLDMVPRFAPRPESIEWLIVDSFLIGPHVASRRPVIYVPILDSVCYFPNVEITINISVQTVTTADDQTVTMDTGIRYRLADPILVRETWGEDHAEAVAMSIRGAITMCHEDHNLSHVREMKRAQIIGWVEEELLEKGIEISYFCIEERALTPSQRFYGVNITGG